MHTLLTKIGSVSERPVFCLHKNSGSSLSRILSVSKNEIETKLYHPESQEEGARNAEPGIKSSLLLLFESFW